MNSIYELTDYDTTEKKRTSENTKTINFVDSEMRLIAFLPQTKKSAFKYKLRKHSTISYVRRIHNMDFITYIQTLKNVESLLADLYGYEKHPNDWWMKYNAEKPSEKVFSNTKIFLKWNNDSVFSGAEVISEYNGTFLIDWNTKSFRGGVNIGENVFSYSLLPSDGSDHLLGSGAFSDDSITSFYRKLESLIH